jgi:hypothetical protein
MHKLFPILALVLLLPIGVQATDEKSAFFERPLNCPLRFSQLANLRNQVQTLMASLGNGCTQSGQQALNQLNNSVANLEGIASAWKNYGNADNLTTNTAYARNVNQILGSLNIITSNNACFYDIKSRGTLPVLSDVIMSVSQFGLLFPSATGMMVASGGYVVGSGLKIVHQLVRKKFNWKNPEERRTFLNLNCSFFDSRKIMEEAGVFNPETQDFRDQIAKRLRLERGHLSRDLRREELMTLQIKQNLHDAIASIPGAHESNLNPALLRQLENLSLSIDKRPADQAEKWRQVAALSMVAEEILYQLRSLSLPGQAEQMAQLLMANIERALPGLAEGGRAWTASIDEYEAGFRGPILAFLVPVSNALKQEINRKETELALNDDELAKRIAALRVELVESQAMTWALQQRLASLRLKINTLEQARGRNIFSETDEGSSDVVEVLDYYKRLQSSILGKEGRGYLEFTIKEARQVEAAMQRQIVNFDAAKNQRERCGAAEKLRFAWAQYRFRVQEVHDFVSTNMDIYRSIFRVGKIRPKRTTRYVLHQMESVEHLSSGQLPAPGSVGELMNNVQSFQEGVEYRLHHSGCF